MNDKIKCPVCGKELKIINMNHINSKTHQNTLKKKGIEPEDDPALELISCSEDELVEKLNEEAEKKTIENLQSNACVSETVKDSEIKDPSPPKLPKPRISEELETEQKPRLTKIKIEPLKLAKAPAEKMTETKEKSTINGYEYFSEEDMALNIPSIPDAPKKRQKITMESPGMSIKILERIKALEQPENKVVLVNCERCKGVIPIPVPKKAVLISSLPVVPISYVHKNSNEEDMHCITIHLDHDFDIRRQRISDVVIGENIP